MKCQSLTVWWFRWVCWKKSRKKEWLVERMKCNSDPPTSTLTAQCGWVTNRSQGGEAGGSTGILERGFPSSSGLTTATDSRGAWGDLEIDQTSPMSVFPASTWQAWRISHLFAESELCVPLLPALRWWTSVSLAAFWKGREESQIGHLVY